MVINTPSVQAAIELLNYTDSEIKKKLRKLTHTKSSYSDLEGLVDSITTQLELEEKTLEKIGLSLTSIHRDEHKRIIQEISLLEFSWKAKRISDDVYVKSINYKLEFHDHYFDQAQRMLILANSEA